MTHKKQQAGQQQSSQNLPNNTTQASQQSSQQQIQQNNQQQTRKQQPQPQQNIYKTQNSPSGSRIQNCNKCGKQFKVIKQEIEFLSSKQLPLPTECPTCRQQRRMSLRSPRELIKSNCDKCGKEIVTTPKPNPKRQVFCDSCFKDYLNNVDPMIK